MTAFTLSVDSNIDSLTSKAGGDTYNTNGHTLTIDQDSRVGLNQTTSTTLGTITISPTLGGNVDIDGTAVRMIAFTGGSGTVPAWNTVITQSGHSGSGKLIAVHADLVSASVATGGAMPASGYIRVKQVTGTYASGALTGITATSSGADAVGWLEIVGDESANVTANRLGQFNVTGAWFALGTTSGSSNQTLQIPNNGLLRYCAGVYIEQNAGMGDYEFYPNAGTTTTTGTEAARGKVVWIDANGLCRIGNSGAGTNGYTPAAGLAVVVPNIFLENAAVATRTANVIPNATVGTRHTFVCTGGGVISMDKVNCAWYANFTQPYSVALTNCCFVDAMLIDEIATAITWNLVGVGNKPTTALVVSGLTATLCVAGGTISNSVFCIVSQGSSGNHAVQLTDFYGFDFINCTFRGNTIRGNATTYSLNATRLINCTFTNQVIIGGQMVFTTCNGITTTNTVYISGVSGTTVTTYVTYVWSLLTNTINCKFDGLTFPVTNTHPYTALLSLGAAGCNNIKMRNIGTYGVPLSLGSANATGLLVVFAASAAASDVYLQRIYTSNTRTGQLTADNSSTRVTFESVFGDYADAADVGVILNFTRKMIGGTLALTAQTAVYGTHWFDCFTSTTVGRIGLLMNEASPLTTAEVSLSGGAGFTSAGGLYMPVVGQIATFTMPYYLIGHTGFANSALIMAGGTATNYTYRYQIDKNDGNGFSAWSASKTATTLGTALNGENSGIDASKGFKLKLEVTTGTTNATAITSLYMPTTSTTTTQAYQYPLDPVSVTVNAADASDGSAIESAQILLYASSGATVTITRSGSTATATQTGHGFSNGQEVVIAGADQGEYNGIHAISNVTTNTYDYTVSGTPATPATGTITAYQVIIDGETDVSGVVQNASFAYSTDLPVTGRARKGTSAPYYKTALLSGTIGSTGLTTTAYMVGDS